LFDRNDNLTVIDEGNGTFLVVLSPKVCQAFDIDVTNPPDWMVTDVASLIEYLLDQHYEYCQRWYKSCDQNP